MLFIGHVYTVCNSISWMSHEKPSGVWSRGHWKVISWTTIQRVSTEYLLEISGRFFFSSFNRVCFKFIIHLRCHPNNNNCLHRWAFLCFDYIMPFQFNVSCNCSFSAFKIVQQLVLGFWLQCLHFWGIWMFEIM